ncbi:hypothetical protein Poli38472_002265 [Pythium oligandrum]|uniref:Clu domain-containing protein n=1 Tax=Pythium oligandrum TaxID=41045 RepID=A0A8K1CGW4_PYTOL|nr:hypothetical protein Poli38472_002265 [Pythium oligandrum]|eukprot:TMW63324.1 hypothetical protein Poli38472_002265 [Pythium oligandrum]
MGAEVSRALEEDAFQGVNGVLCETKTTGETPARRTATDVATRQQLFEFCADWDIQQVTDLLRWYIRFSERDEAASVDLRAVQEQVDTLEEETRAMQTLLAQVDEESATLMAHQPIDSEGEDEKLRTLHLTALQARQQELTASLRGKQRSLRDLKAHLLAQIDDIDLSRIVKWPHFIKSVSQVYFHRDVQGKADVYTTWHPATKGYAMVRDENAPSALKEYTKGDILLPPPANHEVDGHTDDSASSSAASEDNESGAASEEEEEGGDVDAADAHTEEDLTRTKTKKQRTDDDEEEDEDEESEEEGQDKPKLTQGDHVPGDENKTAANSPDHAPPLTAEALASHAERVVPYKEIVKRHRVIKRPIPSAFDASTRSPVFFGYTLEKRPDELVDAVTVDTSEEARENTIFALKIQNQKERLTATLKAEEGKLEAMRQRETDLQAKRQRYWEKRQAEFARVQKELDPNDIYFRTRDVQDKKTRDNETFEDTELRRQMSKVEARMATAQEEFDKDMEQIRRIRSTDTPLGDIRLKFHELEADRYQTEMVQVKSGLITAKEEYVALKATKALPIPGVNSDAKNRAQLLFAEDQIRAKEREVEAICVLYENELFLLKRAQVNYEREQRFLPFFTRLQWDSSQPTQQADFTLLEMATALLLGLSRPGIISKIKFVFAMFSGNSSRRRSTSVIHSGISILRRDAFAEILRLLLLLLVKLGDVRLRREVTRDYLLGVADREFLKLNVVLDNRDLTSSRNGMTMVEFQTYCLSAIDQSKYLSELLGVPWKFESLSRFVLQHMSVTQRYKLGLVNINDVKFTVAKQAIQARSELSRRRKEVMHERALAMGENDPLKTDYSKYLPRRQSKLLSKVVPLDHGGYRNLLYYRMEVILRATIKLQTVWRARKGRYFARLAAEKQAFYHARGVALQEARVKVETEWQEKDAKPVHNVEKMKFEAKIRMKQVKLRTKGHAFSREQVLGLMVEDAVQQAQKEVENRFREMEEELGYLKHQEALAKPHEDVEYLKDEISKALVSQVVTAKQETADVGAMMDSIALQEELAKKKKKEKQNKQAQSTTAGNQETGGDAMPAASVTIGVDDQHFVNSDDQALRLARTNLRKEHMVHGRFPAELYQSGMNLDERRVQMSLVFPDPPLAMLQQRLQQICDGMTVFKMSELLQELPSKRHICGYVTAFRRSDGSYDLERLENDLFDHFRMIRGADALAKALSDIAETDLEFGWTRQVLNTVRDENETALQRLVADETNRIATENAEIVAKKLVRMGYRPGNEALAASSDDPAAAVSNPTAILLQKEQHDLSERKKRVHDAHQRFLDALRLWKEAELSLHETQKAQQRIESSYPVLATHRIQWAERFQHALRLPERDPHQLQEKYTEVRSVCQDFLETAAATALILIRELPLPMSKKTILPTQESTIDGRHDEIRSNTRHKYEAHGIFFKICTDDHGRFENSDEFAAKFGGHEVRNSALYLRALGQYENLLMPLECTIDYHGFRVLCTSKMPIEVITWNEAGTATQKVTKQLVYGTENRGMTVTFQSKELDMMLAEAATHLNLCRHSVRGYHDLTSKILHAPADLLGYINARKHFVLLRFARAMPPEDPEVTPHLCQSTRGMSILWRQLRPELVASFKSPLSSDGLSCLTYGTPDWQTQALGVEEATTHLIQEAIPVFARKLSQKTHYFTAPTFHLTTEMQRHGINVRHLGFLRAQFLHTLSGTATLQYATAEIQTTEDFTREVDRGALLYIQGKTYAVSENPSHRYDAQCITLDQVYTGNSIQNITVWAGRQDCQRQAGTIRDHLLAEMVARTLKNVIRHFLRTTAKIQGTGISHTLYKQLVVHCLSQLTGSGAGSALFWDTHIYEGVRVRFGPRAISEVDRQNMRRVLFPQMRYIVQRVSEMLAIPLRPACLDRVEQHPDAYTFVLEDLLSVSDSGPGSSEHYRIKHNLSMLHFSMASLLLLQATVTQATAYKQLIINDKPSGYWPLCERRGTFVARNFGALGKELAGRYLPGCLLEAPGPIVNIDLNRAIELRKEKRSYVSFPLVPRLYPTDPSTHVTLEAWCRCDGHESTRRVVLTIGRFGLTALKANIWAFSVNVRNIDILVTGAQVTLHNWAHLVGTYDGMMLRLYVDGWLQNEVDVESVVDLELAKREAVIAKTRQDIADMEEEARGKCFKEVEREMQQFLTSKDGKKHIKNVSQKLLDEHEFRVRLSKATAANAGEKEARGASPVKGTAIAVANGSKRDLSKVSRVDFEPLAKKQILREAFETRVVAVVAEFQAMRDRVNHKIAKELEEQSTQDSRELRIGCLSSPSRRDGKYFFHGAIAHVAYYRDRALSRDQVNAHYVLGTRDRAHASDDLFALASSRFARALAYAPDDKTMLERFAENICASLKYDLDHQHAQEMYKKKVRCGMMPFITTENVHGIAEILKNLPRDPAFSDLFIECYQALTKIQPEYFQAVAHADCRLSLQELGRMPFRFFLGSKSANALVNMAERDHDEQVAVVIFADVICRTLAVYPSYYGDQLTSMNWLRDLTNPRAIVHFILALEGGEDMRYVDLHDVLDISDRDMDVIARHYGILLGMKLAHCTRLSDVAVLRLATCCQHLESLDLSYCVELTDIALAAVGKYLHRLKRLWLEQCHQITDIGVEAAVRVNPRLEELGLSYCERVSERCMATIGKSCPNLSVLELELCMQIGSQAMKTLATTLVTPTKLRRLNVGGCRRIADDGLIAIARVCTKLRHVSIRLCDKLTDASVRLLTHQCLELETLNMEEVCLATYLIFVFDQEGDGRGVVDKNLLKKLRVLTLTGCNGLNDLALGHLAHRAKDLESLSASACTGITDRGLAWLLEDLLDHSATGAQLEHLDTSYCPQLSAHRIQDVVRRCPKLVSLSLSGCIDLSDQNLVDIIEACDTLVHLELAFCRELTDRGLQAVAKHLSLETLNVGRCIKLTDDGMRDIVGQFTVLKTLKVAACKKLTDKTLLGLIEGCPLLQELDATHCPHFSIDLLAHFRRRKIKVVCGELEDVSVEKAMRGQKNGKRTQDTTVGDENEHSDSEEDALRRPEETQQDDTPGLANGRSNGKSQRGTSTNLPPIHRSKKV